LTLKQIHVITSNGQQSIFSEDKLRAMWQGGLLHDSVPYWHEGMAEWRPLREYFAPAPSVGGRNVVAASQQRTHLPQTAQAAVRAAEKPVLPASSCVKKSEFVKNLAQHLQANGFFITNCAARLGLSIEVKPLAQNSKLSDLKALIECGELSACRCLDSLAPRLWLKIVIDGDDLTDETVVSRVGVIHKCAQDFRRHLPLLLRHLLIDTEVFIVFSCHDRARTFIERSARACQHRSWWLRTQARVIDLEREDVRREQRLADKSGAAPDVDPKPTSLAAAEKPAVSDSSPATERKAATPTTVHNAAPYASPRIQNEQPSYRAEPKHAELELARLRARIEKEVPAYECLTDSEKKALLKITQYSEHPQPIDYGLTRHDLSLHKGHYHEDLECSPDKGFLFFRRLFRGAYDRRCSKPGLLRYNEALKRYSLHRRAAREAAEAARKAAHDAEMRKRSYWTFLDGYSFEQATAEVLRKHQFTALVTRGSGDGGVDIQVTRNGLRGVVQCKAHINCVGPSVVRDLYGVIHHSGAAFGIVVSRGGFTRGAADFARDKPILFLDTDDLIAMQEGKDVLAEAFARKET
jgi:hypothetical protein